MSKSSIDPLRRRALKAAFLHGVYLLLPRRVALAAVPATAIPDTAIPATAFMEQSFEAVMRLLFKGSIINDSPAIHINMPTIAEDGRIVPLKVSADLKDIQRISIFAHKNPVPLIASFELAANVRSTIATRIKLAGTGKVSVVARAGSTFIAAHQRIKVIKGGCG